MKKFLRGLFYFIIIAALLVLFFVGGYYVIQDIFSTNAKDYLIDKYEMSKYDLFGYESTEYVYEKDNNCESLWFKKCSDDENLERISYIKYKNKKTIKVKEYKDGTIIDNYEDKKSS